MSVAVDQRVDEPIIVLKPDAQVSMQELIDAWFRSTELAQTMEVSPYRILDLRSTNAPQVVAMIRSVVRGLSGAPVDPVLNVTFVGRAPAAPSVSGEAAEAWFETLEDALNHVRALMSEASISS